MSDRLVMACQACFMVLLTGGVARAADKIDVVHLKNGDRITCEIKNLDKGLLEVSTDPAGKLSIHWGDVASLESPIVFVLGTHRMCEAEQSVRLSEDQ